MLAPVEKRPQTVVTVDFNEGMDANEPPLTAHTDTIQAMLLVSRHYAELDLMIRGRLDEEEPRIIEDTTYTQFIQTRTVRSQTVHPGARGVERQRRLTVDQAANGEPYRCKFFNMNELVDGVFNGHTSANLLMINFGGATEVEMGSDRCKISELEVVADVMRKEVQSRQLGELPVNILATRKPYAAQLSG